MRNTSTFPLALTVALVCSGAARDASPAAAQPAPDPIRVTLTEGTNIAVALSPDSETLAFDLVGRIWVMPVAGGVAEPVTDPLGDARQPSWSPDGGRLAFQAYWDGNYHVWSVAADGTGLRQHTHGPFDHREPHWSPRGDRIAFSSDRSGSYDIWTLTVADGAVERVTDALGSEYGPAFSPDGEWLAYAAAGEGGAAGIWVVAGAGAGREPRRIVGAEDARVNAPGWSADGMELVYNAIGAGRSVLRAVDVDRVVGGPDARVLSDDGEDVFPFRVAAARDGYFYTGDGRIRHRALDDGGVRDIRFNATVALDRSPYERRRRDLTASGTFPVRGIVSPAVSPDGHRVAFSALGDLWLHTIGGDTEQVTDDPWIETDPAWSPDGDRFAFSSDRDGELDLYVWHASGGAIERVTEGTGATMPAWAPDGRRIAFVGSGYQTAVSVLDMGTGGVRELRGGLNGAGRPSWSRDGKSVLSSVHWRYSDRFREGVNRALVIPAAPLLPAASGWGAVLQEQERFLELPVHGSVGSRGTDGPVRSPDGAWLAYVSNGVLWAVATDANGDPGGDAPRRLTNEAAEDPTWAGDSRSIVYLATDRLRRIGIHDGAAEDIPLELEWKRAPPPGPVLIRAGAVWDGRSDQLRRDVDIVIEDGRIVAVGDRDPSRAAARVVDAAEGVVMPGLIEMHAHGGLSSGEQLGRLWLSFGVTSVRCPACDPYEITEAKEAGESGRRISPRWFGTGGTVDGGRIYYPGAPALGAPAQVELEMERAAVLGYDLIKTYVRLSDPLQKRVIEEAHAMGLPVTSHELYPAAAYGADGVEHVQGTSRRGYSTKISALSRSYGDVVDLLAASGMTITPTIGIYGAYGLITAEDPSLFDDPRVETFFPWAPDAARAPGDMVLARRLAEDMASLPRRVLEAGGRVVAGTDSPINPAGLSLLAEMEAMVRFGKMRAVDVLRAATSESARALGYEGQLGVVAPGALADLIVIGGDPTADIRAVRDLLTVVHGGRVHDALSLLQRPGQAKRESGTPRSRRTG